MRQKLRQIESAINEGLRLIDEARDDVTDPSTEELQRRVEVMKDKVRSAEEEVAGISARLRIIRKKLLEMDRIKSDAETALLKLQPLSTRTIEGSRTVLDAQAEVSRLLKEMQHLLDQDDDLDEQLDEAKQSRTGAAQVLAILQAELTSLSSGRMSQLKSETKAQIESYVCLEKRLLETVHKKSLVEMRQKEVHWLKALDS